MRVWNLWPLVEARRRDFTIADKYLVLPGLYTSGRGITGGGQHSRQKGIEMVKRLMQKAREVIDSVGEKMASDRGK